MGDRLTLGELEQDREVFEKICSERTLRPEIQEWVEAWREFEKSWDFSELDRDTATTRFGHYMGWFARKRKETEGKDK